MLSDIPGKTRSPFFMVTTERRNHCLKQNKQKNGNKALLCTQSVHFRPNRIKGKYFKKIHL